MNKKEYYKHGNRFHIPMYKSIHNKLRVWKTLNGITERCVVHHRDDTEETRKYNEEHYELWGYNLDGTFEYGKYVLFMTLSEHTRYHSTGRHLTEETRKKISIKNKGHQGSMKGKHHSEATKQKMSEVHKGEKNSFYGKHHSDESRLKISENHVGMSGKLHSSNTKNKMSKSRSAVTFLYNVYRTHGGMLSWNEFQRAFKKGEIVFETQPISIFVK